MVRKRGDAVVAVERENEMKPRVALFAGPSTGLLLEMP